MNLPIQAPPVPRGQARVRATGQLRQSQAATTCDWQKCGGAVFGCLASCLPSPSVGCIMNCLGPLVGDCLPCVTHH
jgi:hypothetical protein